MDFRVRKKCTPEISGPQAQTLAPTRHQRLAKRFALAQHFGYPRHTTPRWAGLEVFLPMAEVRVQEGEPLENALRRFKRKVQTEDIIKEVKRHSFYLKPGEKKRVKQALARKRNRKKARKEAD
jgi:small subunit ribosomal protein S21